MEESLPTEQQIMNARVFESLANHGAIGLCLFDETGGVTARIGPRDAFLPDVGGNIEDSPLFVGLMESVRKLKADGGFVEMPSLGMDARSSERFDLRICWLADESVFAALVHPASGRIEIEFTIAQAARQNRLLMELVQQQQDQIKSQNELLRVFVAKVPAAVAMLDKNMNYLMVSQRWQEDFPGAGTNLAGKPFAAGLPGGAQRWQAALQMPRSAGRAGVEKLESPDGQTAWHRWERAEWHPAGQHEGGTLVFSENITRMVQQTARLRAQSQRLNSLNQEMRQFSLAISHDLRAPIRQIAAFAQFMMEEQEGNAPGEYVNLIRECASRMLAMIDALLAYAKISQAAPGFGQVPLSEAVSRACANLRSDVFARGALVSCNTALAVRGDPDLLSLVFQNLIDNSLKYADAERLHISLDAEIEGEDTIVRFTDNGPGIAANLQGKAFDLFQRLGGASKASGAGVGLTTCRKIIELHGGKLTIDPEFSGGLRYLIRFPGAAH